MGGGEKKLHRIILRFLLYKRLTVFTFYTKQVQVESILKLHIKTKWD